MKPDQIEQIEGQQELFYEGPPLTIRDDQPSHVQIDVRSVDVWLDTLPISTWGRHFSITQPDTRKQAAEWFAEQMERFLNSTIS